MWFFAQKVFNKETLKSKDLNF